MSDHEPPPGRRRPTDGAGSATPGGAGGPGSGGRSGGRAADAKRREADADDAAVVALRNKLSGVLRRLPDVERRVLELRMGLVDGVPAKPGQVAERLGLTIAEVRTIEARAFTRIREVGSIKGLERFLGR